MELSNTEMEILIKNMARETVRRMSATVKNDKGLDTREGREIAHQLIAKYKEHSNETGFLEWKKGTPAYVKKLEADIIKTQSTWGKGNNKSEVK